MLERQRRLDETGDSGRRLGMADIGLHRTDQAAGGSRGPPDGRRFNGIARGRSRAVGFHEGQLSGAYAPCPGGRLDDGFLRVRSGNGQSPAAPVLVCSGTVNDRVDRVAVLHRRGQGFQHDEPRAVAASVSLRRPGEGPAAPVRRQHLRLLKSARRLRRQQ